MRERALAGLVAVLAALALWAVAFFVGVPYVIYSPGVTVNVMGNFDKKPVITIAGAKTYRESAKQQGQLRMTTVYVTQPKARVTMFEATKAYFSRSQAVYPYSALYGKDETPEQSEAESAIEMVSSQDAATAAALSELDYSFTKLTEVLNVAPGMPAYGKLEVRDVLVKVGDTTITKPDDVVKAVQGAPAGVPLAFEILRDKKPMTVEIKPEKIDGTTKIGIAPGPGFDFPLDVKINIDPNIGGPSAGLLFSLSIYDLLTPGPLAEGRTIAGTGTIDETGKVGPIGGIRQKIVAAREAGAGIFLVPPDNCHDVVGAANDNMRLVMTTTMHDAVQAIQDWTANPDAELPACPKGNS